MSRENGFHRPGPRNVLGDVLEPCSMSPRTGFYRTGRCQTGGEDAGLHVVCARMTEEFLEFSKRVGNDLSSPAPQFGFEGLKPGDCWCLGAARWREAWEAGVAPPVRLAATHEAALQIVSRQVLEAHALEE